MAWKELKDKLNSSLNNYGDLHINVHAVIALYHGHPLYNALVSSLISPLMILFTQNKTAKSLESSQPETDAQPYDAQHTQ